MSNIDTVVVDSLKVLDLKWPIREADMARAVQYASFLTLSGLRTTSLCLVTVRCTQPFG